jgi:hypothetical protein
VGKAPKHGFHDYVKNPDLYRDEVGAMRDAQRSGAPGDEKIKALVGILVKRPLEYEERMQLQAAGDHVVPYLLEALRDPQLLHRSYDKTNALDGSPLEAALDLLEPFGMAPIGLLEPALRHESEDCSKHALYHLARCANDDAVAALKEGLESGSQECRTYTLMGLGFLEKTGRGSPGFRAALFDSVVARLGDTEFNAASVAPRTLFALDRARAISTLRDGSFLRPNNPNLHRGLEALKEADVPVPGQQLRDLLAAIKDQAGGYPGKIAYGTGLILLARAEGAGAMDLIADAKTWGGERVLASASEAAQLAAGVANAYGFVWDKYKQGGAEGLTKPQLDYLTLYCLDAEVNNSGFSQFFFNSSGDLATHAVAAATAVGAAKLAEIIRRAVALFGNASPDRDRDKRMDQLAQIDLKELARIFHDSRVQ